MDKSGDLEPLRPTAPHAREDGLPSLDSRTFLCTRDSRKDARTHCTDRHPLSRCPRPHGARDRSVRGRPHFAFTPLRSTSADSPRAWLTRTRTRSHFSSYIEGESPTSLYTLTEEERMLKEVGTSGCRRARLQRRPAA